jgi:hypothetical protein
MGSNSTVPGEPNMGKPQFASHEWLEPIVCLDSYCCGSSFTDPSQIVLSIMIGSLIINRRRGYRIFESRRGRSPTRSLLPNSRESRSPSSSSPDSDIFLLPDDHSPSRNTPKTRSCCGLTTVTTPNTSRFANHFHSRVLAKFPFLIEMFYWVLNFLTYAVTKTLAANFLTRGGDVWDLAQAHGISVLWTEHAVLSFMFPIKEADFQSWFLNGHPDLITFLNRLYSLVHIPGTVTYVPTLLDHLSPLTPPASYHGTTTPPPLSPTSPPSAAQ